MKAPTVATLYPRHGDFVRLQQRLDPRGPFRNEWLQSRVARHLGWSGAPSRVEHAQRDRATARTRARPGTR
jgi:hypothetical protein